MDPGTLINKSNSKRDAYKFKKDYNHMIYSHNLFVGNTVTEKGYIIGKKLYFVK